MLEVTYVKKEFMHKLGETFAEYDVTWRTLNSGHSCLC